MSRNYLTPHHEVCPLTPRLRSRDGLPMPEHWGKARDFLGDRITRIIVRKGSSVGIDRDRWAIIHQGPDDTGTRGPWDTAANLGLAVHHVHKMLAHDAGAPWFDAQEVVDYGCDVVAKMVAPYLPSPV